jgi:hypothetical protein
MKFDEFRKKVVFKYSRKPPTSSAPVNQSFLDELDNPPVPTRNPNAHKSYPEAGVTAASRVLGKRKRKGEESSGTQTRTGSSTVLHPRHAFISA